MSEPNQTFNAKNLDWMRRWHSQAHLRTASGTRPTTQSDWQDFLKSIENAIAKDEFSFEGLRWHSIRRKRALSTSSLEDTLVIRKINDNLRRAYGLRQPNRTTLIKTTKQALKETTPKTVVRLDLRQCFESICRQTLLRKIKVEARLSTQTTALLDKIFEQASRKLGRPAPMGIPRGMNISTSLAEIKLRDLDRDLRVMPGVYLYLRYVDDILIFSTAPPDAILDRSRKVVRTHGLRLNERKSEAFRVACICENTCPHQNQCPCLKECICPSKSEDRHSLEYLGYKLTFSKYNNQKKTSNDVFCLLSDRKSQRLKTRLVQTFRDCRRTQDWALLEDRIRYLASNQRVAWSPGRRGLFNGLSYTHSEYDPPNDYEGTGSLKELDQFYRMQLRLMVNLIGVTPPNLQILESLTFTSGFKHHRRTKFSGKRVKQIQSCWEN